MERLLKSAMEQADQAEVLAVETRSKAFNYYNYRSTDLLEKEHLEVSLRVIKDGKIGVSRGSLTAEPNKMVEAALTSAAYGAPVSFTFPAQKSNTQTAEIYDSRLAALTAEDIARDGQKILKMAKAKAPEMPLNIYIESQTKKVHILNSSGKNESYEMTIYTFCLLHMFERSKEGINKEIVSCQYFKFPEEKLDELIEEYNYTLKPVAVSTRPMSILFRPSATWSLLYRVLVGASGENYVKEITPLKGKIGNKIFPESVTLIDDPTRNWCPGSVPFDDEGVPTLKKFIVEKGILRNFIFDLDSGARSGKGSSGNGFKRSMWNRGIDISPNPRFTNLVLETGDWDYRDMIKDMEEGVIVNDVIGFHSGNMLQGEFSMNVGIGAYVKNGKVVGRAVDTMVTGNIYEDFFNLKALGKTIEYNPQSYTPDMYFAKMSVSGAG